jgi:hypothetical protein
VSKEQLNSRVPEALLFVFSFFLDSVKKPLSYRGLMHQQILDNSVPEDIGATLLPPILVFIWTTAVSPACST